MLLLVQVIGYAARAKSGNESPNWTLGPYIIQSILLLVAPALYAATIYMELGRIVLMIDGEGRVLISKKWMTKIFVTGDVLSFILQAGGKSFDPCCPAIHILTSRSRRWLSVVWYNRRSQSRIQNHHRRSLRPTPLLRRFHRDCDRLSSCNQRQPDCPLLKRSSMAETHAFSVHWKFPYHGAIYLQGRRVSAGLRRLPTQT